MDADGAYDRSAAARSEQLDEAPGGRGPAPSWYRPGDGNPGPGAGIYFSLPEPACFPAGPGRGLPHPPLYGHGHFAADGAKGPAGAPAGGAGRPAQTAVFDASGPGHPSSHRNPDFPGGGGIGLLPDAGGAGAIFLHRRQAPPPLGGINAACGRRFSRPNC